MGAILSRGGLTVRLAEGDRDVGLAQALRHRAFRPGMPEGLDVDPHDQACAHVLVERGGALVATYRYQSFAEAAGAQSGYAAQFYDLSGLRHIGGPMIEMGRFCLAPDEHDPDIVRLAWAAMTRIVDSASATVLFGCSSFRGTDPAPYMDALRLLRARHVAPAAFGLRATAPEAMPLPEGPVDGAAAQRQMPPLLRTYLIMGGWVSDHLVVDRVMDTLHVFTGVEIAKVPPGRARALRLLAGD
ncbi:MAG: GNAT family N-acyltransferase [Pseudomonadota bacterium]|nr:GNAT family N-acyltransferase [Pseudomonadota bacterium]